MLFQKMLFLFALLPLASFADAPDSTVAFREEGREREGRGREGRDRMGREHSEGYESFHGRRGDQRLDEQGEKSKGGELRGDRYRGYEERRFDPSERHDQEHFDGFRRSYGGEVNTYQVNPLYVVPQNPNPHYPQSQSEGDLIQNLERRRTWLESGQ